MQFPGNAGPRSASQWNTMIYTIDFKIMSSNLLRVYHTNLLWILSASSQTGYGYVQPVLMHQGLYCPLLESMATVVYVKKQRMLRSDCTDLDRGLGGSVGCAVRLETRRSRVQPPPRSATFFRGDWSWNIFYGHSLPSADSRRAVVSFWRKNVHNTG